MSRDIDDAGCIVEDVNSGISRMGLYFVKENSGFFSMAMRMFFLLSSESP